MKRLLLITSLVFPVFAALAQNAYVQSNPVKEQASDKTTKEDDRYVWIDGIKYSKRGTILIETGIRPDGTPGGYTLCVPGNPRRSMWRGIIRIEMQDGSVQEIDLKKLKRITLD